MASTRGSRCSHGRSWREERPTFATFVPLDRWAALGSLSPAFFPSTDPNQRSKSSVGSHRRSHGNQDAMNDLQSAAWRVRDRQSQPHALLYSAWRHGLAKSILGQPAEPDSAPRHGSQLDVRRCKQRADTRHEAATLPLPANDAASSGADGSAASSSPPRISLPWRLRHVTALLWVIMILPLQVADVVTAPVDATPPSSGMESIS